MNITLPRAVIEQALEALEEINKLSIGENAICLPAEIDGAMDALRERLAQPGMQPCAGRNCGSTNPNLHSAECFEDYEKSTGMDAVAHSIVAGALFDFMGWLTSRKKRIVLSSADDASPAAVAIHDFAEMRGLILHEPKVQEWQEHLTAPPQRKPLSVEQIAELDCNDHYKFARAIEAAHNIKE